MKVWRTLSDETIKVLIVDDSPLDAELTATELRECGLATEFATATDERELRLALTTFNADVILCDFSFPQFDGIEAVAVMREYHPDVPVIFVSGTISEERAAVALQSGAVDYVLKSNLTRLPSAVRRAVSEAQVRKRLRGSVVVAEFDRSRQSERLAALWHMASDRAPAGDASLVAMLTRAAAALLSPQPFAGVIAHVDGSDVVAIATTLEDEDGRGRVPDVGSRTPLASTLLALGGRTESWSDLTAPDSPPGSVATYGWRCLITTQFTVGDERFCLTFGSLEPLTRPFGADTFEYVELFASAFAMRMRIADLEESLAGSK